MKTLERKVINKTKANQLFFKDIQNRFLSGVVGGFLTGVPLVLSAAPCTYLDNYTTIGSVILFGGFTFYNLKKAISHANDYLSDPEEYVKEHHSSILKEI